jgi:hypothetical protein
MPSEGPDHRESVSHMLSEFFRELAVLVVVFVPLDYLLKDDRVGRTFWSETTVVAVFSSFFLGRPSRRNESV